MNIKLIRRVMIYETTMVTITQWQSIKQAIYLGHNIEAPKDYRTSNHHPISMCILIYFAIFV